MGRIKIVFLYKFISEIMESIKPLLALPSSQSSTIASAEVSFIGKEIRKNFIPYSILERNVCSSTVNCRHKKSLIPAND